MKKNPIKSDLRETTAGKVTFLFLLFLYTGVMLYLFWICLLYTSCDHGFVSVYLVQKGISPRVIAMDVRPGPLEHAREHIREYGLEDRIETVSYTHLDVYKRQVW